MVTPFKQEPGRRPTCGTTPDQPGSGLHHTANGSANLLDDGVDQYHHVIDSRRNLWFDRAQWPAPEERTMNLDKLQYTADPADAHFLARRHILAIDDDPQNRELITEYLGQNDLRITAVPDGPAMRSALEDDVVDLV